MTSYIPLSKRHSRLTEHFLTNVIGNPLDTTVSLSHIVFGGNAAKLLKIKPRG